MRMRHTLATARRVLALLLVVPAALGAQVSDSVGTTVEGTPGDGRRYEVAALAGYQWFDKAAALRATPTMGLRIVHPDLLSRWARGFTVGANAAFARPTTRGDYFPWNRQIYYSGDASRRNDTTLVYEVSQQVTMAWVGIDVGYRYAGRPSSPAMRSPTDWRALELDASVGPGLYGFWLDPEQKRRNEMHSRRGWLLGGGIGIPITRDSKLLLRAEDLVFVWYDRNWFSLSDPLFSEELWRNPVKTPPAAKGTVHNARLTVQFSFVPGGSVTP
jgi:hypothetical protein